jgi:type II secretory pathway pseudopilin PulG
VLSAAQPARQSAPGAFAPTLESLSGSGGGTEIFRFAAAFGGTLTFIVFVGLFSLRTMLLRQPGRVALLAGKLAGLLAFAALILAAPGSDDAGGRRARGVGVRHQHGALDQHRRAWCRARRHVMVMLWVTGYAVFGMTVPSWCARSRPRWPSPSPGRGRWSISSTTHGAPLDATSPGCCSKP